MYFVKKTLGRFKSTFANTFTHNHVIFCRIFWIVVSQTSPSFVHYYFVRSNKHSAFGTTRKITDTFDWSIIFTWNYKLEQYNNRYLISNNFTNFIFILHLYIEKKQIHKYFTLVVKYQRKEQKNIIKALRLYYSFVLTFFSAFEVSSQPLFQTKGLCCKLGEGGCDATTTL